MSKKVLFVDTNIFLHFRRFDQIDWNSVAGAAEVKIIVAAIVLSELDKHKDQHQVSRIKRRAESVIRRFHELIESEDRIRPTVEISFEDAEPKVDYDAHRLDRTVADDRLLASLLSYREQDPSENVALVADDAGIKVKAKRLGIKVVRMPEAERLPVETDPQEKKIKELEGEVRRLQVAIPRLDLSFANGDKFLKASIEDLSEYTDYELADFLNKIKAQHPKRGDLRRSNEPESIRAFAESFVESLGGTNNEDIAKFNDELEEYYKEYIKWVTETRAVDTIKRRTLFIDLKLSNNGSAPAEDIDIFLHFPDGMHLVEVNEFPEMPPEPEVPVYVSKLQRLTSQIEGAHFSAFSGVNNAMLKGIELPGNVSHPNIRKTNNYDVEVQVGGLKHKMSEPLHRLYAFFPSFEDAAGFKIDYRINTANSPDEVTGELNVKLDKASPPSS